MRQVTGIEDASDPAGMFGQVAAVDAHAPDLDAALAQMGGQRDQLAGGGFGIVGVEQQHHVAGLRGGEMFEGVFLTVMSLDQRMRHGAEHGNIEAHAGQHGGAAGKTGQIGRPGGEQGRLGAVGAAHAEIHQ